MENQAEYCRFCDVTTYHDPHDRQRYDCCRLCIACKHPDLKHIEYVFTNQALINNGYGITRTCNVNELIFAYFGICESKHKMSNGDVYYTKTQHCKQLLHDRTVSVRFVDDSGETRYIADLVTSGIAKYWRLR